MSSPESVAAPRSLLRNLLFAGSLAAGAALVGAVGADLGRNRYIERRTPQDPAFYVNKNLHSHRTILLAGGCQSDGKLLHELLAPKLLPHGNVVTIDYPKASFDKDRIAEGVARTLNDEKLRNVTSVGLSMGGMVNAYVAKHIGANNTPAQIAEHFGTFGAAIKDGSPSNWNSVDEEYRGQIALAQKLRISDAANKYKRYRMQKDVGDDDLHLAENPTDIPLLKELNQAKISTRLGALAAQGAFMQTFENHVRPGDLEGFYQTAYLLHAPEDPVIHPDIALPGWQAILGEDAVLVQDETRPAESHALTPYRPSFTVGLVAAHHLQPA